METDEFEEIEDKYIDPIEPYFTWEDIVPEEEELNGNWIDSFQVDSKIK